MAVSAATELGGAEKSGAKVATAVIFHVSCF